MMYLISIAMIIVGFILKDSAIITASGLFGIAGVMEIWCVKRRK